MTRARSTASSNPDTGDPDDSSVSPSPEIQLFFHAIKLRGGSSVKWNQSSSRLQVQAARGRSSGWCGPTGIEYLAIQVHARRERCCRDFASSGERRQVSGRNRDRTLRSSCFAREGCLTWFFTGLELPKF